MLICIDAGHGRYTPGKRCLKSLDPEETREWVLNARVADKVQELLRDYDCQTMRVDDQTGERDISLQARVNSANKAGADLYLSIHHNAGIKGGSGGGIVVYVRPAADRKSKQVQQAIYRQSVIHTGLRGNRANPTPEGALYVLKQTSMPAVLGEFGFMDSAVDVPIILTQAYAERLAKGIVAGLREAYQLKERERMSYEQWKTFMSRYLEEQAKLPVSSWAEKGLKWAEEKGITDGSRPQSGATRQEVALMISAAVMR